MAGWTPAQARYDGRRQVVTTTRPDTPESPGLTQHYVPTRHGIVARTWCGDDLVEVTLRRGTTRVACTYQGHVQAVTGGWVGYAPDGTQITGVCRDYLDAEAPLLPRRTGVHAQGQYRWPRGLVTATSALDG